MNGNWGSEAASNAMLNRDNNYTFMRFQPQ
jgi:hypothetical protein